jgi:hypothetical protein
MTTTVIPAQPGYWTLYLDCTEGAPYIDKQPVIAWSIAKDDVNPVNPTADEDYHALVLPDGRVWHYAKEEWFDTLEEIIKHLQLGGLA